MVLNLIAGPPDPPRMLSFLQDSITSSSVVLTWVSGFHGGADQIFGIQYRTSTTSWHQAAAVRAGMLLDTSFNVTVGELASATEYIFRVFAENKYGRSDFSSEVKVTTNKLGEYINDIYGLS